MKHLLRGAEMEIMDLRRQNEVLRAKVDMIDLFALILNTKPHYPSVGASEDVAWALRKAITEIEQEEAAKPKASA